MDIIASVLLKRLLLNGGPWNEDQFTLGGPTCEQNHNTCNSKYILKDINLMWDQKSIHESYKEKDTKSNYYHYYYYVHIN